MEYDLSDIDELINDREKFNNFVYTPIKDAVAELEKRRKDFGLDKKIIDSLVGVGVPEPFTRGKPKGVLFRQIATPNYEIRRFLSLLDSLDFLEPLLLEYLDDKFTSNNQYKHSLGKMFFFSGRGKKGGSRIESLRVVDFNSFNGKKLSKVQTVWGENLYNFHHNLFKDQSVLVEEGCFYDSSSWFKKHKNGASEYYLPYLKLFVNHAILFENFVLDDDEEREFTKNLFLPFFIQVIKDLGLKPLIVALEPTNLEDDRFWMCHPQETRLIVDSKVIPLS